MGLGTNAPRSGDARSPPQALRQVLAQRPFILAFLVSLLRDFALAESIFQDLCVGVSSGRSAPPAGADVGAWARAAVRRRALATLRARSQEGARVPTEQVVDQIENAIAQLAASQGRWEQRKAALGECLQSLPAHLRRVLDLRYSEDLSPAGVAERLDLGVQTAGEALLRARAELSADLRRRLRAAGGAA
jgi:RNA polymerase sigma-70 factor (ECF subfamily)